MPVWGYSSCGGNNREPARESPGHRCIDLLFTFLSLDSRFHLIFHFLSYTVAGVCAWSILVSFLHFTDDSPRNGRPHLLRGPILCHNRGMLERTVGCIEPASQLFLRRLEPPIRTQRALGPAFWKNGGNKLDVPRWWPLFLEDIRASRHNPTAVECAPSCLGPSWLSSPDGNTKKRRSRASRRGRTFMPRPSSTASRPYTRSTASTQEAYDNVDHFEDALVHSTSSEPLGGYDQDGSDSTGNRPYTSIFNQRLLGWNNIDSLEDVNQNEIQLIRLIERSKVAKSRMMNADLDSAWHLFNKVRNQEVYATEVFHLLCDSSARRNQELAYGAFKFIDEASRTEDVYRRAVRAALRAHKYRLAIKINTLATKRNLHKSSSILLLFHAVSNQLWNTAACVWKESFEQIPSHTNQTSSARQTLTKEVGGHRDLPYAIHRLGNRLREKAPVIAQHLGTLSTIFNELLFALVRNGHLMSIVTPQGLWTLLQINRDLGRDTPSLYATAIDTINKSAVRPDKGSLADLMYNALRSNLPEVPPAPTLYGSLFSIHLNQGTSANTYNHYLNEFAKIHGVADQMSYQRVLSALAAQGHVDSVQEVFLRLCQAHEPPMDVAFYTPLMYAYARLGDVQGTQKELQRMLINGLRPNEYCWNILMYAYSRSAEPKRAFEVLEKMRVEGTTPDAYTFTTLTSIVARTGDTEKVLDILEQAQQNQVKGSYELVTGLIQSYCLNGQADAAERVAEAATTASLQGHPTTMWNYLLRHYAFLADSESMLRVQQRMHAMEVKADAMTHATFMTGLVVMGRTKDATRILRTLNLNQILSATPFHYAIVLHGFAQEGDRDMANVVYQEMIQRFPRLGASPRLSMLHLQARRNVIENEVPRYAAQYLEEILHELSTEERAQKQPQPGLRRRRGPDAVPSLYLEYFVELLLNKAQVQRASKLMQRFEALAESSYLHIGSSMSASIHFLNARLMVEVSNREWDAVEMTWRQILERGIQIARPFSSQAAPTIKEPPLDGQDSSHQMPRREPMQPVRLPGSGLTIDEDLRFNSMIPESASNLSPLDEKGLTILYSQRHILEASLIRYMEALAVRQTQNIAITLVSKLRKVGFALTGKNWNMYIQTLARSHDPDHWILAFDLFEKNMIANTPPWPVLVRGKWLPPRLAEQASSIPIHRKGVERRDPEQLIPTYYTTVHLAGVLLNAQRLAADGDKTTSTTIWKTAPFTCRFIRRMPHHKDRIQGLLLRGRGLRPLPQKRTPERLPPDRAGVLGSRAPSDHVPAEELSSLGDALKLSAIDRKSPFAHANPDAVQQAELLEEQVPLFRSRAELKTALKSETQFRRRVRVQEGKLSRTLHRMRRDLSHPRVVSDMYIGHPAIPKTPEPVRKERSSVGQTLYGTDYRRLVQQTQARKKLLENPRAWVRQLPWPQRATKSTAHSRTGLEDAQSAITSQRPPESAEKRSKDDTVEF